MSRLSGGRTALVTVGTTEFDQLIGVMEKHAVEVLEVLRGSGFCKLIVQTGRGTVEVRELVAAAAETAADEDADVGAIVEAVEEDGGREGVPSGRWAGPSAFVVESFRFTSNLVALIEESDLVVSHAGAGSILETLRSRKPLLVVVNDTLQENHQVELAAALQEEGYLAWCTPDTFVCKLKEVLPLGGNMASFVPYPDRDVKAFPAVLDSMMGFQ